MLEINLSFYLNKKFDDNNYNDNNNLYCVIVTVDRKTNRNTNESVS